jgi:hypothetical protein
MKRGLAACKLSEDALKDKMLLSTDDDATSLTGMSNDADSTTGTETKNPELGDDTYSSGCEDIDNWSWVQDSRNQSQRPSLITIPPATPPTELFDQTSLAACAGAGRAVPGFSLQPPEFEAGCSEVGLPAASADAEDASQHVVPGRAVPGFSLEPPEFEAKRAWSAPGTTLEEQMQDIADHMKALRCSSSPEEAGGREHDVVRESSAPPPRSRDLSQQARSPLRAHSIEARSPVSNDHHNADYISEYASDEEESWNSEHEQAGIPSVSSYPYGSPLCRETEHNIALVEAFKVVLLRKEKGFVRAWRNVLDLTGRGRITFAELCDACRRLGFRGPIRDLWRQLDATDAGGITLGDLDYDSAETLGRFHCALVARHGSLRTATKAFGLNGARRLQQTEFCNLLRSHGVMRKQEAGALFRTLCLCPPASSLDRDAGISVRDFEWLHNVSKHLPQVMPERVHPGSAPESQHLGANGDFYDIPESSMASDEEIESNGGSTVFEKLYQNAMDLKDRRRDLAEAPLADCDLRGPVDPRRFERLYQEAQTKREEAERRTEDFYRQQNPQNGRKQISGEVWERLVKPKEKGASDLHDVIIRPERSTCWGEVPIAQIRTACEQEGMDCKGKTKEDLLNFLKQLKHREAPKAVPKATWRMEKLYSDHQRQLKELEKKRLQAAAKEEEEIAALQMKPTRAVRKNLHEHLHARAAAAEKRRMEEAEKAAAKLEAEIPKAVKAPVGASDDTFLRLYMDGYDKGEKAAEKKRILELEEETQLVESSIHKNKTADPHVFHRLYNKLRRGEEEGVQDPEANSEEEENAPSDDEPEPAYDPRWQQRGAMRPPQEELKGMLRKKMETVEQAQRRSISSATDAALPKRGQSSSLSSLILARDVNAGRNAAAGKKQRPSSSAAASDALDRKVRFKRDAPAEFHSSDAGLLREFAKFFFGCFPTIDAAMESLDLKSQGRVSLVAFMGGMKRLRYQGDAKSAFRALDVDCTGSLGRREFQILNVFHPHLKADSEASGSLRAHLESSVKSGAAPSASSQQKMKSSSTPSLAVVDRSASEVSASRSRPGESTVQPPELLSGDGYPHKQFSRMRNRTPPRSMTVAEPSQQSSQARPTASAASKPPLQRPKHCPQAPAEDVQSQARYSQLASNSGYPVKGRLNLPTTTKLQQVSATAGVSQPGKTTPSFGELGLAKFNFGGKAKSSSDEKAQLPSDAATDGESQTTEVPLVCEDELLRIGATDDAAASSESDSESESESSASSSASSSLCSHSSASSAPAPQQAAAAPASDTNPKPAPLVTQVCNQPQREASLLSTESSAGSACSSPHSVDTESMPWQEGPRSTATSCTAGTPAAWAQMASEDGDLQAEVRQLLLQYKLDNEKARPEAGASQAQQLILASGPELSSRSAWIDAGKPAAQQA